MPSKSQLKKRFEMQIIRAESLERSLADGTARIERQKANENISEDMIFQRVESMLDIHYPEIPLKHRSTFNRKLKTKNPQAIALAYARHILGDFPVSNVLQEAFMKSRFMQELTGPQRHNLNITWENTAIRLFAAVRSGRSVFKEVTKDKLSKKETHTLVNSRHQFETIRGSFVYAIAIHEGAENGLACKIARMMDESFRFGQRFRELIRFFIRYNRDIHEMRNVYDYALAMMHEDTNWSIVGRTPVSMQRGHEEWVRQLNRISYLGSFSWEGFPYKDMKFTTHKDSHHWNIFQILNTKELGKEGQNMHHCVSSYRDSCRKGTCAIFTVRYKHYNKTISKTVFEHHEYEKCLTMEICGDAIVQVRGYANRMPHPIEREAVEYWAAQNGLVYNNRRGW
jgi:hypothetical protein